MTSHPVWLLKEPTLSLSRWKSKEPSSTLRLHGIVKDRRSPGSRQEEGRGVLAVGGLSLADGGVALSTKDGQLLGVDPPRNPSFGGALVLPTEKERDPKRGYWEESIALDPQAAPSHDGRQPLPAHEA